MKCPTCGIGNLVLDTRDMPYSYKGKSTTIRDVTGRYCDNPECREVVMELGESIRTTQEMLAFNKKVNAKLSPIDLLANVRQRFKLTQQQAAKVFGGGANAFSRYESGKTKPPLALIKLFKILDKHPDLFEEVSSMNAAAREPGKSRAARVTRTKTATLSKRKRHAGVSPARVKRRRARTERKIHEENQIRSIRKLQ